MSVQFTIAKEKTKDLEGGYWNDPSAGHTYRGITYRYFPSWPGWALLFKLGKQRFGGNAIPRYTIFSSAELDKLVADFYRVNFWNKLMNGDLFRNQDIANFIYDFLVHKPNDAVAVFNHTAKMIDNKVSVSKNKLTPSVIAIANNQQEKFYALLRSNRAKYYLNTKSIPGTNQSPFSKGLAKEFVETRVNKFPAATRTTLQFPSFTLPWQNIK